ncbi:MAG: AAA family ATPase [Candidatus Altiarchaeales archaeon]|nr:AAA family ATPase [Candidatus Altiarchaeales archaeon]MBD3415920.1 AAA family ATPase [Candidatus Altiarchaeales archaeon]
MEKISTGIDGLDEMLHGGFISGRPYLIVGGPGAGKTILCMQFLMDGVKNNERCLYVALEEQASQLKQDMASFGWDIQRIKLLDTMQDLASGLWAIKTAGVISKPEFTLKNLIEAMRNIYMSYKPKRVVIDSLTSIKMLYESRTEARRELLGFLNFLETTNCTTLLTSELEGPDVLMEEFLASGVIKLHLIESEGERLSAVSIQKMRGTAFDKHMRPMKITDEGITVFPNESVFG